jgi:hypothetical protein
MAAEEEKQGDFFSEFEESMIYNDREVEPDILLNSLDNNELMQYPINKNFVKVKIGEIQKYVMDDIINGTYNYSNLSEDERIEYYKFNDLISGNNLYIRPNKHVNKLIHVYYKELHVSKLEEFYTIDLKNTSSIMYNIMQISLMNNYLLKDDGENVDTMDIYTLADGVEERVFNECMKRLINPLNPNNFNIPRNLTGIIYGYVKHNIPHMKYHNGQIYINLNSVNADDLKLFVQNYIAIAHALLSNGAPASMNSSRSSRSRNSSRSGRSSSRSGKSVSLNSSKGRASTHKNWRNTLTTHPRMITANTHKNWRKNKNKNKTYVSTKQTKNGKRYGEYNKINMKRFNKTR